MASKLRLYFSKAKDNHNDENNDMYCVVWPFLFLSIIIIIFFNFEACFMLLSPVAVD